jgi:hypothetical protein
MEHDRGAFKVNYGYSAAIVGGFGDIANFPPRLTDPQLANRCQKIRHLANVA